MRYTHVICVYLITGIGFKFITVHNVHRHGLDRRYKGVIGLGGQHIKDFY